MNLEEFRSKLFGMSGLATVEKAFELYSELEAENERLKKEVADYHQLQWQHDALIDENERLKGENAKLRCTALHAMIGYGKWAVYTCHYKYRHGIMYIRWCDFTDKVKKAYRKAKKELKEGK